MASVNRKSLSLTDVARFNRRFKGYGFAEEAKVKQSYMLTPFDLSECVGPLGSPYPKEPLGPQPGASLFEPPCSFSLRGEGRNKHGPRKASSATVLTLDQELARKRLPFRKSYLSEKQEKVHGNQDNVVVKTDGCTKSKVDSTDKVIKERKSRIPVPIKTLTASKSVTEIKQIVTKNPTVAKRHFSSPNLGRIIPSKIPVRVTKNIKKDSTEKSNNDIALEPTKSMVNESSKGSSSLGTLQTPAKSRRAFLAKATNKTPKGIELFTTSCNDSSVLVVTFETDSGEETEKEKNLSDKAAPEKEVKLPHTDVTKGDSETTCLQSSIVPLMCNEDSDPNDTEVTEKKKNLRTEEKLNQPAVLKAAKLCGPVACYHQSSILLLTCETDCSSDSEAEVDKRKDFDGKLPQTEDVKPSMTDMTESKDSVMSKQKPTVESDSGIVLSRVMLACNQSSLLVMSHDTDCTSDCSTGEGSPQELNSTNEEVKHEPTVCTDNYFSECSESKESSHSVRTSGLAAQTELSVDSQEEKYSLFDKEFLRMAKLLDTTVPHSLNLKEGGIQKEKTRRRKRTQQKLPRTALGVGVLSQQTADQMVSHSLSSSGREDNELPDNEETREDDNEFRSYKKENILLRGQLERLKQTNSTLRSNERNLQKRIEDEAAKKELLNNKSRRLREQVKVLKRELKKTGVKSKKRGKTLTRVVENLQEKLTSADKLASTLKSSLQESNDNAAQQKMKLLEVDKAMSEQIVKLQQLEAKTAAQRDELQYADKLASWQKAELQRANEEIEKQRAELRVADEETVKQLEKIHCTFAVLEEHERVLKDTKELSEKELAKLEEQIATCSQKFAQTQEQLEVERNNNVALQVQISDMKNQLAASCGLEQETTKLKGALESKNQQLSDENKRLRGEVESTKLRFASAKSELQKTIIARDTLCNQLEEQVRSLEKQKIDLCTPKREQSSQTLEIVTQQTEKDFCLVGASGSSQDNPDVEEETGPDFEQLKSELYLPNTSACAKSNERNASRFLWLIKECAQLRELLRKFELEHRTLVEKTDGEKEMMRGEIDRLRKESLRKDIELDMMESSLEELGKVKNYEIRGLKQVLRRREEECAMIKVELRQKEDKTKIFTATQTQTKRKWFSGRQQ